MDAEIAVALTLALGACSTFWRSRRTRGGVSSDSTPLAYSSDHAIRKSPVARDKVSRTHYSLLARVRRCIRESPHIAPSVDSMRFAEDVVALMFPERDTPAPTGSTSHAISRGGSLGDDGGADEDLCSICLASKSPEAVRVRLGRSYDEVMDQLHSASAGDIIQIACFGRLTHEFHAKCILDYVRTGLGPARELLCPQCSSKMVESTGAWTRLGAIVRDCRVLSERFGSVEEDVVAEHAWQVYESSVVYQSPLYQTLKPIVLRHVARSDIAGLVALMGGTLGSMRAAAIITIQWTSEWDVSASPENRILLRTAFVYGGAWFSLWKCIRSAFDAEYDGPVDVARWSMRPWSSTDKMLWLNSSAEPFAYDDAVQSGWPDSRSDEWITLRERISELRMRVAAELVRGAIAPTLVMLGIAAFGATRAAGNWDMGTYYGYAEGLVAAICSQAIASGYAAVTAHVNADRIPGSRLGRSTIQVLSTSTHVCHVLKAVAACASILCVRERMVGGSIAEPAWRRDSTTRLTLDDAVLVIALAHKQAGSPAVRPEDIVTSELVHEIPNI